MGDLKTRRWRSPVPQSEKKLFLSVNYLTPVDRYLNDAAERRRIGRPSDECRLIGSTIKMLWSSTEITGRLPSAYWVEEQGI